MMAAGSTFPRYRTQPGTFSPRKSRKGRARSAVTVSGMEEDGSAASGREYRYRVLAVAAQSGARCQSLPSDERTLCRLGRPTIQRMTVTDGVPAFRIGTVKGATAYVLCRQTAGGEAEELALAAPAKTVVLRDPQAEPGVEYTYTVLARAETDSGVYTSAPSKEKRVLLP